MKGRMGRWCAWEEAGKEEGDERRQGWMGGGSVVVE